MNLTLAQQAIQVLLVLALYAFLGAILVFLWRDDRRASFGGMVPPAAYLVLLGGPEPTSWPLTASTLIGRAADNAIPLDDSLVSAYHARISFAGGQWLLEDLGSRNGTRLNEMAVEGPVALAAGDEVHIGETRLRFSTSQSPPSSFSSLVDPRRQAD